MKNGKAMTNTFRRAVDNIRNAELLLNKAVELLPSDSMAAERLAQQRRAIQRERWGLLAMEREATR